MTPHALRVTRHAVADAPPLLALRPQALPPLAPGHDPRPLRAGPLGVQSVAPVLEHQLVLLALGGRRRLAVRPRAAAEAVVAEAVDGGPGVEVEGDEAALGAGPAGAHAEAAALAGEEELAAVAGLGQAGGPVEEDRAGVAGALGVGAVALLGGGVADVAGFAGAGALAGVRVQLEGLAGVAGTDRAC